MTKTLQDINFEEFTTTLIDELRFPGSLSIDAHGFCQAKDGEAVFIFASPNSSIDLWNEQQHVLLRNDTSREKTRQFFQRLSLSKFEDKWFLRHSQLSDLESSGLYPRRVVSLLITFDPSDFNAAYFTK